jgi:replication-associated recombination protein RarA
MVVFSPSLSTAQALLSRSLIHRIRSLAEENHEAFLKYYMGEILPVIKADSHRKGRQTEKQLSPSI